MTDLFLFFGEIDITKIGTYVGIGAFAIFWLIVSVTDLLQRYGMLESKTQKSRDQRSKRIEDKSKEIEDTLSSLVNNFGDAAGIIINKIDNNNADISTVSTSVKELHSSTVGIASILSHDEYGLRAIYRRILALESSLATHMAKSKTSSRLLEDVHGKIVDQVNQGNIEKILRIVRSHDREVSVLVQRHPDGVEGRQTPRHFCSVGDFYADFKKQTDDLNDKIGAVANMLVTLQHSTKIMETTLTTFPNLLDNVRSGQTEWVERILDQNKHVVGLLKALAKSWGDDEDV